MNESLPREEESSLPLYLPEMNEENKKRDECHIMNGDLIKWKKSKAPHRKIDSLVPARMEIS